MAVLKGGASKKHTRGQSCVRLHAVQEVHSLQARFEDEHSLKTAQRLMNTSDDGPNYSFPMSGFQSLQYHVCFKSFILVYVQHAHYQYIGFSPRPC